MLGKYPCKVAIQLRSAQPPCMCVVRIDRPLEANRGNECLYFQYGHISTMLHTRKVTCSATTAICLAAAVKLNITARVTCSTCSCTVCYILQVSPCASQQTNSTQDYSSHLEKRSGQTWPIPCLTPRAYYPIQYPLFSVSPCLIFPYPWALFPSLLVYSYAETPVKGTASHLTRRRCRSGSLTWFRACSHRRLSMRMMDRSGRAFAVRCKVEWFLASVPCRACFSSLRAADARSLRGFRRSSRKRIMLSRPLSSGSKMLPTMCWWSGCLMNSGGVRMRNSGLARDSLAVGESSSLSRSTFITESVPPPQRSG